MTLPPTLSLTPITTTTTNNNNNNNRRLANNGGRAFPSDARLVFAYGHLMDGPIDGVSVGAIPSGQEFRCEGGVERVNVGVWVSGWCLGGGGGVYVFGGVNE
jgi:hypothetical protein